MPPAYVKPYVKRNKNDAADAEVICEAVTRPSMRFVAIKKEEQPGMLMLHRTRELLVRQRTMLVNAIRGHMAEFGMVARASLPHVKALLTAIADPEVILISRTASHLPSQLVRSWHTTHLGPSAELSCFQTLAADDWEASQSGHIGLLRPQ